MVVSLLTITLKNLILPLLYFVSPSDNYVIIKRSSGIFIILVFPFFASTPLQS